jgi:hypothetical protein
LRGRPRPAVSDGGGCGKPMRARLHRLYEQRRSERGWRQPDHLTALASLYELDAEPSAEDTAILQSLMWVGHAKRVEFLG